MVPQEGQLFAIDWERGVVADAQGVSTVLRAQSLAVLRELHSRAGNLVSKEDLLEKVWPNLAVTDDSLVQCVAELRRALRDDKHSIIKTLPKRGYIFETTGRLASEPSIVAPIFHSALQSLGGGVPVANTKIPDQSIAVLPFSNLSGDAEQEYFTDGLSEDIIIDLSKEPGLFVIARSTSFSYKGKAADVRRVALELGVKYILEGSVRRSGQRIRINATLSDAIEGRQLWADRFDRDMDDIFGVQDEVTQKIVTSISGRLADQAIDKHRPRNLIAYDLHLRGRHLWGYSPESCLRGLRYLSEAVTLEHDYAVAHAELGVTFVCAWLIWSGSEQPNRKMGDHHSKIAVELAPHNSQVLFRRGWVCVSQGQYDESSSFFQQAIQANASDADSWLGWADLHFLIGDMDAAVLACTSALRLNPRPPPWYYLIIGSTLIGSGKYQEAVDILAPVIDQNSSSRRFLAVALAKLGRREEALQQSQLFTALSPLWSASEHIRKRAFKSQLDREWWQAAYVEAGLPA